jgi:glycosyltransferase involved in cell wall biosynthesis
MTGRGKEILLIDSATSGCAGAYIDAIHRHLTPNDTVEVGVSHYFPFEYGKRIFFKYSELTAQSKYHLGRARLYVRFLELLVSFARLFAYVCAKRIKIVCYAISSNLSVEYAFLWLVKHVARAKVFLICHDVIPFVLPGQEYDSMVRKRRKFYALADRLIVHNENSASELKSVFQIPEHKIAHFPFPIYELSRMELKSVDVVPQTTRKRFLFIGHLRPEKGIEVLLEAWKIFAANRTDVELIIAGNVPNGCAYDFSSVSELNVAVISKYLTDDEYVSLIRQSDCVVLPYTRGTNSAVVSTVVSLGRNSIVSDIDMFRNNPLIPAESFFQSGSATSLVDRFVYFAELSNDEELAVHNALDASLMRYKEHFQKQVNLVFDVAAYS